MRRFMLATVSNTLGPLSHVRGSANFCTVTTGKIMNMEELGNVHGRPWDDVDVSGHRQAIDLRMLTVSSIETI